jgi:hypothetical protein
MKLQRNFDFVAICLSVVLCAAVVGFAPRAEAKQTLCPTCQPLVNALQTFKPSSVESQNQTVKLLEDFKFSNVKTQKLLEIQAFIDLVLLLAKTEAEDGDVVAVERYKAHKTDFDTALMRMKPSSSREFRKLMADFEAAMKNGNS